MAKTDKLIYAREKFLVAVRAAVSADPPIARVEKAWKSILPMTVDGFADWPDLQEKYKELMGRLTAAGTPVQVTLDQMKIPEAGVVLGMILEFYLSVRDKLGDESK